MVQHKEIKKETPDHLKNGESHQETLLLNGKLNESEELTSDEDDYLRHLLVVPSLDRNVSSRNTSLITESLLSFYTAIESKKEYSKIKQELMGDLLVPVKEENQDTVAVIEKPPPVIEIPPKAKTEDNEKLYEPHEAEQQIGVMNEEHIPIRKFTIYFPRARFVPENEPSMYDQFLVCRRCTIFFKSNSFRKMHNQLNHRKKKPDSTTKTPDPPKVRKRIRSGGKGKLLVCDLCSKTFRIKALIRSHMNCHTTEKPLLCDLCPYAGKRTYDLKKHHLVHHNPDRIKKKRTRRRKCDKCPEILDNRKAYRVHMRLNHREKIARKPRIYKKCEKCQEAIFTKKGYKLHMKEFHRDFLYIKCDKCNRRFKTNFRLKKHKLRYASAGQDCRSKIRLSGEYKCEHCPSKFPLSSHLKLHLRKHHKCENCQQVFSSKFKLKYHEFSHLDTEPKCQNCAKVFSSEQKFSTHLRKKLCVVNGLTNGHVENGISI